MSRYLFGVGNRKLSAGDVRLFRRAARKHGVEFVHVKLPEGWRFWFSAPNKGSPFDEHVRNAVIEEIRGDVG